MPAAAASKETRRPKRIAADEAHAWARNLRIRNSLAKLVLSMTTIYVDHEGDCFVGIPSLAQDTELAPNTVRSRLEYLEAIGAISRIPQWVDELGRRNGEGRGRRTTDIIRLNMKGDVETIEARARGEPIGEGELEDDDAEVFDPPQHAGSDSALQSADPAAAVQRQSDSAEGLRSEPEPEPDSPPQPPPGAAGVSIEDLRKFGLEREPTHEEFWKRCGAPATASRRNSQRQWERQSPADRLRIFLTWQPYCDQCASEKRKRVDPSVFIARELWTQFEPRSLGQPAIDTPHAPEIRAVDAELRRVGLSGREPSWSFVSHGSQAWREWHKAFRLAGLSPFRDNLFQPNKLAGREVALHGRYFPQPLPPTAPDELRLATGAELERILTEPAKQESNEQ